MDQSEKILTPEAAFRRAVEVIGSQIATARLLKTTQASISRRLKSKKPCRSDHVLKVEEATGISRHALRPDIYPADADSVADRHNGVRA